MASAPPPPASRATITAVVCAYFVISISMVFVNKALMDKATTFEAPLFVTWFQCMCTVAICWVCGELGKRAAPGTFFAQFPAMTFKLEVARRLLPLSVAFTGMVTFNNLCLQYVEVSFYNVARSLTIVFNVALTYFMLGESTSRVTLVTLGVVIVGFFVGSGGEVNFSLLGTAFGVLSSVFVSLNSIYTKKVMPLVDNNQWTLAAYNNLNAVIMFAPLVAVFESRSLLANVATLTKPYYWGLMCTGGVFGFLIGIVTIMQIKVTSPLTHNISGTAKACVQTVLALLIWRNPTTAAAMAGVALVLGGSFAYAIIRNKEMDTLAAARKAAAALRAKELDAEAAAPTGGASDDEASKLLEAEGKAEKA